MSEKKSFDEDGAKCGNCKRQFTKLELATKDYIDLVEGANHNVVIDRLCWDCWTGIK
ncbi:MAG: hypothetical protein WC307_03085 [Candidatus Nanoarchaeia archaeon]